MTNPQTSKLTAQAAQLRRTLRAALVAADADFHPGLMGVLLHSHAEGGHDVLAATATDRYIMAQLNMRVHGQLAEPVYIGRDDVKLLASFLRRNLADVEMSVEARAVTIAGQRFGGQWASLTVPLGECVFPKTFADKFGPHAPSEQPAPFSPHLLRKLAKMADRLGADIGHLHIGLSERGKPMVVHIGDAARVVVMPSKFREDRPAPTAPPVFNPYPNGARA